MAKLNSFCKTTKDKKRFGRSGCFGGTSGRGHKGYKARSGSTVKGFEGGQTPIYRRLPMRGFNSNKTKQYVVISLKKIFALDSIGESVINKDVLFNNGFIKSLKDNVKLIGSDISIKDIKNIKQIDVDFATNGVVDVLNKNNIKVVLSNN